MEWKIVIGIGSNEMNIIRQSNKIHIGNYLYNNKDKYIYSNNVPELMDNILYVWWDTRCSGTIGTSISSIENQYKTLIDILDVRTDRNIVSTIPQDVIDVCARIYKWQVIIR